MDSRSTGGYVRGVFRLGLAGPYRGVLLLSVVALAVSIASAAPTRASPLVGGHASTTSEHIFTPLENGRLAYGLHLVKTVRGACWTGSSATARADAWRCMSGNVIYDPCFSDGTGVVTSYVVCALSPFQRSLVKFVLTKRVTCSIGIKTADPTRYDPWFIVLTSGVRCGMTQGATATIAGMRIAYGCSKGGWLVGSPHRAVPTWRIFFTRDVNSSSWGSFRSAKLGGKNPTEVHGVVGLQRAAGERLEAGSMVGARPFGSPPGQLHRERVAFTMIDFRCDTSLTNRVPVSWSTFAR
jgi:hypothetical protein